MRIEIQLSGHVDSEENDWPSEIYRRSFVFWVKFQTTLQSQ